jgi:SAM-dependent methyltransferase
MQPTKFDLVINCKTASAWLRRAAVAARPRRRRLLSEAPRAIKLLGGAAAGWPLAALARQRPASTATEIIGLEPSPKLLEMANKAARKTPIPLRLVEGTAEAIPIEDHDVDAVVTTWTMCSIPEIQTALQEMRRVLRPGGAFSLSSMGARRSRECAGGRIISPQPGSISLVAVT